MTRSHFALAARADEKWIENAGAILHRRLSYTREEAAWLGLVRELVLNVGLPLLRASEVADEALGRDPAQKAVISAHDAAAGIEVDLPRYYSTFITSLSAAQNFGGEKRRGRTRRKPRGKKESIEAAKLYGVDVELLRDGLELSARERLERLNDNAMFVAEMRRSPRAKR